MYGGRAPKGERYNKVCMYVCMLIKLHHSCNGVSWCIFPARWPGKPTLLVNFLVIASESKQRPLPILVADLFFPLFSSCPFQYVLDVPPKQLVSFTVLRFRE